MKKYASLKVLFLFGKNILKTFSQKTFLFPKSDQKLVGGNDFLFLLLSLFFRFFFGFGLSHLRVATHF
jgi:hypothetical protein